MNLILSAAQWAELRLHLFGGDVEHAAFLYATRSELAVSDIELMEGADVVHGLQWHITLSDAVRPRVIKRAWDSDSVLIEAHSHRVDAPACFSPTDIDGLADFAPHVLWRLPERPYVALVFAPTSFDALVWRAPGEPAETFDSLTIGNRIERPTGKTIGLLKEGGYGGR